MLAGVKEAWLPLRSQWLDERVLLAFDDRTLQGVGLRKGGIGTPGWQSMLPAQALHNGMPEIVDVLGDFVGDLLLSQGLMGQPLRVALPPQAAHWRVISWPFDEWPDDPIEALLTIAPDLGLPFDLDRAAVDLQPLPGRPLRSLLVAAPVQLVEAWIEAMALAGLPLERLVPAQVCIREALLPRLRGLDPRDAVVLLHPEATGCSLQLWRQTVPVYDAQLPLNGPELAAAVETRLAYVQSREPDFRPQQLWISKPLPQQEALADATGLSLELLDSAPYDSLVLQGLAQLP